MLFILAYPTQLYTTLEGKIEKRKKERKRKNMNDDEEEKICTDLATFLRKNPTAGYTGLYLKFKRIGPQGGVAIGQSLQTNNSLLKLNLENNNLGPEGGVAIGQSLQTNNSLLQLNLLNNNLGPEGGVAIGQGLQTNNSLLKLILNYNNLGPEGGVAIGQSLQTNNSLLELHLGWNKLGPEGGVAIGQGLQINNTLQRLNLINNKLGPESGVAIGQSLQTNNTLQKLYLAHNNLGNDGAVAVIRGIAVNNQNTSITDLKLTFNNITRLPAELTQCPPTLTRFSYSGNPIDYIPPNVQRWLDRFQEQQNAQIHQDSQNVHNRQIQQCIKDSLNKIINATGRPNYQCLDEVRNVILNDSILSAQCKTQLIEYALDNSEHTGLRITFCEALQYVFTRIDLNEENGDNIKAVLNQEMTDALCMCFTGRITRLLNCLNKIDPLVHIHIVNLNDMFRNVGERLIKEDKYTTEAHQTQFEKELQEDYGYELTEEFRKELDNNFYCVIEDFYETVCPQATQKIQVKSLGKAGNSSSSAEERSHPVGTQRILKESFSSSSSSSSSSEANIGDERDREEVRKNKK